MFTFVVSAGECAAQSFPSRPIRFVVPYGAGGGPDVIARVIGHQLGENVGQQVVVDNRPGAGGLIAAELAMKAPSDGYTLFIADTGHVAINPALYKKLPYDPQKDFTPVTLAVSTPLFMAVNPRLPVETVKQFIDYAKTNPGVPYGSSGNGSSHHLGMELLRSLTGVRLSHVPYKGVAQSVPAVIAGDVSIIIAALPSLAPHVKSGKVRLIAVGTPKRTPTQPNVPTVAESGVPGYEIDADIGFLAPAGTAREVVARLHSEIVKVLHTPAITQRLAGLGIDAVGSSPEEYAEAIRAKTQKYAKLVRESGAQVD
jgi:tripartite-type tricarboxylate transporter receptor subunit TctC